MSVMFALDLDVGVVVKEPLEHRGDLGGRAGGELAVDAELLLLDVPVDHHARAAVAVVPLGHQVGVPGAELLGIRRAGRALAPQQHVADLERLVDDLDDRAAQPVAGEVQATEAAKRGLGVGGVPVGRLGDPLDPDVRPDPERRPAACAAGR